MTALAQNSPPYFHPGPQPTRRISKILAGVHIFAGALTMLHGDRLMPAGSLNNATTAANGGPLQVPGGDIDGTLRLIAKAPNVRFLMGTSGGGSAAAVSVTYGSQITVNCSIGSGTTALTAYQALQAHADAMRYVDVALPGTGGSLAVAITATAVPFVRLAGISDLEYDNSAVGATDYTWVGEQPFTVRTGIVSMANDGTDPASSADVNGIVTIIDDQTIARTAKSLRLSAQLFDWSPTRGPFIRIL